MVRLTMNYFEEGVEAVAEAAVYSIAESPRAEKGRERDETVSDLASFQRTLDLYGAAFYWSVIDSDADNEPADLAIELRERAATAGASSDQLADAERYARACALKGRKPLMAGQSFSRFRTEAAVQ